MRNDSYHTKTRIEHLESESCCSRVFASPAKGTDDVNDLFLHGETLT